MPRVKTGIVRRKRHKKVLKEAKEIFNLKYIAPNNDISNTRNMINDIIIDEESIYILCGYNKWKLESENKK